MEFYHVALLIGAFIVGIGAFTVEYDTIGNGEVISNINDLGLNLTLNDTTKQQVTNQAKSYAKSRALENKGKAVVVNNIKTGIVCLFTVRMDGAEPESKGKVRVVKLVENTKEILETQFRVEGAIPKFFYENLKITAENKDMETEALEIGRNFIRDKLVGDSIVNGRLRDGYKFCGYAQFPFSGSIDETPAGDYEFFAVAFSKTA